MVLVLALTMRRTMINMDGKLCPVCREFKPLSEYGKRMSKGKNIGQSYCRVCKRIIDRNNKRTKREMKRLMNKVSRNHGNI